MTDWIKNIDKTLIRCSSLSALFTEPKLKEDKLAGKLSATAKTHLIEVYAREMWGVEKDIITTAMKKGIQAEGAAIELLNNVEGKKYTKNQHRIINEWISGHPDIIQTEIVDTKVSWDAFTFLPKLIEEVDKSYYYQLQGYMWLCGYYKARVAYCLVDTPDNLIQGEKYKLLRSMDVVGEDSPEYVAAAKKLESNMRFSHIPPQLRIINHWVDRDESIIEKIPEKVEKAREFLIEIAEKHLSLYKTKA